MSAMYDSFLLRCWSRDGLLRIDVEHIQSGQQTRLSSLVAITHWIENVMTELGNVRVESQGTQKTVSNDDARSLQDTAIGLALHLPSRVDS